MANPKKTIITKSFIESKMSASAGIRTRVLRLTDVTKQNLVPILNNIDVICIGMLSNIRTL